jgi:hypothetical protein
MLLVEEERLRLDPAATLMTENDGGGVRVERKKKEDT